MSDPSIGAEPPDRPSASKAGAPPDGVMPSAEGGALPASGRQWHGYAIGRPLDDDPCAFQASNAATMEQVIVRMRPITDETPYRRVAWERLQTLPPDSFVACIEAVEENGHRIEVTRRPPGPSMREWMICNKAAQSDIERLMKEVAGPLTMLQDRGLVHLKLSPNSIFVAENERDRFVLGGLEEATPFDRPGLMTMEVDPLYAPPEAAGLSRHSPGEGLCAWDWWSLGRVAQEFVLGRHVYGIMLQRDVVDGNPDVREKTEQLLLGHDPTGVRAGAVEIMPDEVPSSVLTLVRGLLADSRDGRWQAGDIDRWLKHEAVSDRYDLAKSERLFVWHKRGFTVPEAADFFTRTENWAEGEKQLYEQAENRPTLVSYLAEMPAHKTEHEFVKRTLNFLTQSAWDDILLQARHTAVASLIWLGLQDPSRKNALRICGRKIDAAGVRQLLGGEHPDEAVALVRALTTEVFRKWLEPMDASSAQFLGRLATGGGEALHRAIQNGWIQRGDCAREAELLRLALETDRDATDRVGRLHEAYATSRDPELAALMANPKPEKWALLLLAFTGAHAADHGYLTHEAWNRQRHEELSKQAKQLSVVLFWLRLHRLMRTGPVVFGEWPIFWGIWLVTGLSAGFVLGWGWGAGSVAFGLALRTGVMWRLQQQWRAHAPANMPWTTADRPGHCLDEARRAARNDQPLDVFHLLGEFHKVAAEAAGLPLEPPPPRLHLPSSLPELWCASTIGAFAVLMLAVAPALTQAFAWWQARAMAVGSLPVVPANGESENGPARRDANVPFVAMKPSQLFDVANDGFGWSLRGPLKAWDLPRPATMPPLIVDRRQPAAEEQAVFATVSGLLLLEPYPRQGVDVTLAVRVPAGSATGLMLFDTVKRALIDRQVFILPSEPQERTWYTLSGQAVVYLGMPAQMPLNTPFERSLGSSPPADKKARLLLEKNTLAEP